MILRLHVAARRRARSRELMPSLAFGLAASLFCAGCREELGPENFPTARVVGVIVEGSRPVGGGFVEFHPVEGTRGSLRSARVRPDGAFDADRVPVGEVAIRIVNAPIRLSGGAQLFEQFSTPVRRIIPAAPDKPIRIDVLEEAARYQAERARRIEEAARNQAPGAVP